MVLSLSHHIERSSECASSCACHKHKNLYRWRFYHPSFLSPVSDIVHTHTPLQTQMMTLFFHLLKVRIINNRII